QWINADSDAGRMVILTEKWGDMEFEGVTVGGKPDRIDRLPDGTLAIVDYKTGRPPSADQVKAGFALQLGVLGLIAKHGSFDGLSGDVSAFEYWSLAKDKGEFGFVYEPIKKDGKRSGVLPEEFLPLHEAKLRDAIGRFIKGDDPFIAKENPDYPGYTDYDQLMRLDEWITQATVIALTETSS
ncbi:MAG: PD-(D/E)XK nuclease family protein, partial [Pseudomonadota bacterium]